MFFRRVPPNPYVKQEDQNTFRLRLRTRPHSDTVELRFTKSAHISHADEGGFVFRKQIVSDPHFDRGEVTVRFNARYQVTSAEGEGVDLVPISEW